MHRKAKSGRRCGSDKKSLELVHRDLFGRFTPRARFLYYPIILYALATIFSASATFVR